MQPVSPTAAATFTSTQQGHRCRLGLRDRVRRASLCLPRSCERDLLRRRERAGLRRPLLRDLCTQLMRGHGVTSKRDPCATAVGARRVVQPALRGGHFSEHLLLQLEQRCLVPAHLLLSRVDLLRPRSLSLSLSLSLSPRLLSRSRERSVEASRPRPRREERSRSLLLPCLQVRAGQSRAKQLELSTHLHATMPLARPRLDL